MGIKAGGERGGALFHSQILLQNPYVLHKVLEVAKDLGWADFEFEV
jgi:hypothetical protein